MEGTTTGLEALFESVGTVITNILGYLATVATNLLENPIFQLMIGIAVLFIVIGIVFRLVKKMRKGGR